LALPTDSSDTFLREVDENLRRDQLRNTFKRYGGWIAAAAVLFLAAVGGWLFWQERQRANQAQDGEQLAAVYKDIGTGKLNNVQPRLAEIADGGADVPRASALFTSAAVALEKNDRKTALARYREVQADEGLPQPYRDLALLRATALEFDSLKPDDVVARLQPMTKAGEPWFGTAGEMTAMALLKQNKKAEAGRMFAAIAADRQVPDTLRARAVQIAGTLGVDASAFVPLAPQPTGAF